MTLMNHWIPFLSKVPDPRAPRLLKLILPLNLGSNSALFLLVIRIHCKLRTFLPIILQTMTVELILRLHLLLLDLP